MIKNVKIALCLTLLCALAPTAFASSFFDMFYIGAEAIQTNQNYKSDFGKNVFKKNPQNYNFFGGINFTRHFGSEFGYEFQPYRAHSTILIAGQAVPGNPPLTGSQTVAMTSNIRGNHPYLGFFIEYDQKCSRLGKIKYQALLAGSLSAIIANSSMDAIDGVTQVPPQMSLFYQHKIAALVKLSATCCMTNAIGLRLSLNYHSFNQFNISSSIEPNRLKLKATFGIGLGLTYSFTDL